MHSRLLQLLAICFACGLTAARAATIEPPAAGKRDASGRIYVIPVREQIGSPILYIVRRGLKEAERAGAEAVILDMKTPGGALDTTLEIMEAIAKFPGKTLTYINNEAMSAGAFISATTDEIWFAPSGIIGAAAPVGSSGQDVEATMKQKVVSYLKARVRATTEGKGTYRGQVISAMIDSNYELKIDDKVIKEKGELLSLTAIEAAKTYGDPAQPLLSAGTAKSIDDLIAQRFGGNPREVTTLEVTWSENLAVWLNAISPLLLGLGILCLYIEFKTPGFGVFGITGIACLAIVFLGSYVAGLSGHEPMVAFGLGLLCVAIEIFFFPGIAVLALTGIVLILGSLVWAMADLWPHEPLTVAWSADAFAAPVMNLGLGMLIALALALALARFIPKGWFFTRLAVAEGASGAAQRAGVAPEVGRNVSSLVGRTAVAATGLYPSGQIEIDGRRYEARLEVGSASPGTRVVVRRSTDFGLVVDREEGAPS